PTPTTTTPPPPVPTPTTTTPPPAAPTAAVTYTVVAGDTLYKIATKFHTTVSAIASANGITNVNLIRVGQKLKIPSSGTTATTPTTTTPPPAAPVAATTVTYTVVAGDTLGKIAAKYHTTVMAIAVANKIKNVNLIVVGQKLTITTG
ncbi:MAG TPA: LysM peptidoglycan-binding domain-containing protein, partial [Demequinaceae bacterium]